MQVEPPVEPVELQGPEPEKGTVFNKHMVEGMLTEKVASMKASLDVLTLPESVVGLTQAESVISTYCVFREEANEALKCLEPYTDAALTPRHRDVRIALYVLASACDAHDLVKLGPTADLEQRLFVQAAVRFLKRFHIAMKPKKKKKRKKRR